MGINKKQFAFSKALAELILFIYESGHTVQLGDVKATTGHIGNSKHYRSLAADINLFFGGEYLKETKDHLLFGIYWEGLGGIWAGRFNNPDGNHYEWPE